MDSVGPIYTIVEAAARLRISRRKLQDLLKAHPHYALNGNRKLFSDDDIAKIWEGMKQPVRAAHPDIFDARTSTPVPTADDLYASLLRKKPARARLDPRRLRAT